MFHELILTLNGYAGDVFEFNGISFQIRTDLKFPLLHSSELVVLNDLLEIASLYKNLIEFIDSQQTTNLSSREPDGSASVISGVYVSSICHGLRELLKNYVEVMAGLELKILNDPYITLNHIRVELEPFRTLFRALTGLVSAIKAQERSTCNLVEVVKSEYDNNIPLQEYLKILIPWIHRTLYKQITNWVVFGTLADPTFEFFIQLRKEDEFRLSSTPIPSSSRVPRKSKDLYCVNYSIVPSHFSIPLVERILFLGNSITILEKSDKTRASLMEKQKVFFEKMKDLPLNTFRTEDLCDTIDELACCIGKELHHLVVTETDLPKHLGIVKDFYLGGRGELFHDFLFSLIENTSHGTTDRVTGTSKFVHLDVRGAFALAAGRVQVQEDVLHRIEILAPLDVTVTETDDHALQKCLTNISLKLEHEWPLHILFTPESMERYNELFRFLLQIRLLQLQLLTVWTDIKRLCRMSFPDKACLLLIDMSYVVNNLQHYLQADVLESQFSILMGAVERSENFDQIRVAHAAFQANIWAQVFFTSPMLHKALQDLLEKCRQHCQLMRNYVKGEPLPKPEAVEELIKTFSRHVDLTISRFKGVAGNPQIGPHLSQFLLRLDFNSYFSKDTLELS